MGIGSQIWAVPESAIDPSKYFLISAGTRFTAIYNAWRKEQESPTGPDGTVNVQVAATINGKTPPVLLFNPKTPKFVLEWLRDTGNDFHDLSSAITFIETFGLVKRAKEMWDRH